MSAFLKKAVDFCKEHLLSICVYTAAAVGTLALVIPLCAWTIKGKLESVVAVYDCEIQTDDNVKTEYLVNQPFNPAGISLKVEKELVPASECTVRADFSGAGETAVELTYQKTETKSYRAYFDVNVLFVRSMSIESYPYKVDVENGVASPDGRFAMYAYVATEPQTNAFGEVLEVTSAGYKIKLSESMCTQKCSADAKIENFYTLDYYCGDLTASFSFYNAAGRSFIVSSPKDIVEYGEINGLGEPVTGGAKLQLVVTSRDDSYQIDCTGKTSGYYIYTPYAGADEVAVPFEYQLKDKEECFLLTEDSVHESLSGNHGDEGLLYYAELDGRKFAADAVLWQSAVVNGSIVEDHGFMLVINSEKRILHLDYTAYETTGGQIGDEWLGFIEETPVEFDPANPTLTLYVTDYSLDPKLGTGNGYSRGVYVYTAANGQSYKVAFYLGAFTWTYVPLSSQYDNPKGDAHVSDVVYLLDEDGYPWWSSYKRGKFYVTVTTFKRGEGTTKAQFVAAEDAWLNPILGL